MRDYALNRAIALEETRNGSLLKRLLRNWRARRNVTKLENFDDHMLSDLGVTRAEVEWASHLPLSVNAALALEDRAFRRRKSSRFE
jgi:uncharacterized protein YjiS (DUF1127 family)